MRLLVIAVGQRQPAWAEAAWADYARRFPPELRLELKAVKTEPRLGGKPLAALQAAEAQRIAAALPKGARRVVLDEHGLRASTAELAARLSGWREGGATSRCSSAAPTAWPPSCAPAPTRRCACPT